MNPELSIVLIGALVAVSGALLGTFLVLRRQSMMTDAISHAILPGIVAAYAFSGGHGTLPALIGAAAMGLLTVAGVELLTRSGRVKSDAAIGLIFPLLFALGVIWVSRSFRNVHLDLDAVLYGEIVYAPLNTVGLWGQQIPEALLLMGGLTLLCAAFVGAFYKELKLSTFDPALSAALGFSPVLLHYALMGLLSLTAVGAFEAVGAVLIIAFVIVPPACAFLLTRRLGLMLALAVGIGVAGSVLGYGAALWIDASVAGSMASVLGIFFLLTLLFAPKTGIVAGVLRRRRQAREFSKELQKLQGSAGAGPAGLDKLPPSP